MFLLVAETKHNKTKSYRHPFFSWRLSHSSFRCLWGHRECILCSPLLRQYITWMLMTRGVELPRCIDPSLPLLGRLASKLKPQTQCWHGCGSLWGVRDVRLHLMRDGTGRGGVLVSWETGWTFKPDPPFLLVFPRVPHCYPNNLWLLVNTPTAPLWWHWSRKGSLQRQCAWRDDTLVMLVMLSFMFGGNSNCIPLLWIINTRLK